MEWLLFGIALLGAFAWWGRRTLRGGPAPTHEGTDACGPDDAYTLEIGDELDLHGVSPHEVDAIVDAFLEVAVQRQRARVKIIHGKGTGRLRARVRRRLDRHPEVIGYGDAASPGSGWGATIVHLRPASALAPDAGRD